MHKKLMLACMAIAAFAAFVVAPAASASPVLTDKNGGSTFGTIAVGASIKGTNEGVTKFTASGFNVECNNDLLSGTVTENSGSSIKGEIPVGSASFKGTGTSEDCTSALGSAKVAVTSKLCLATAAEDKVTVTGCGANVVFDLEVTGTGNCKYSTASISGTYATSADAKVTISEQSAAKTEGGIFCPSSGKLDMVFNLTTTNGETILIS
ncbi:MAG: hypothetical protein ACTHLH_04575 [Solirubrobacterales bacterium]